MRSILHSWRISCVLAASLLVVLPWRAVPGQTLTDRLISDIQRGELRQVDFGSAAFIAGGVVDESELERCHAAYIEMRREVLETCRGQQPAGALLAELHRAMHQKILRGKYRAEATDLRKVLQSGDFNCLSAVAIYWDICQSAGQNLEIWLGPGHVDLRAPGIVESIAPATKAWQAEAPSDDDDGRGSASPARQITPVELLGKFYYNRGVALLERQQFAEGLALVEFALRIDPADSDARENQLAGLNNWAVERLRARRPQEAAALIKRGLTLSPAFAPLIANERLLHESTAP